MIVITTVLALGCREKQDPGGGEILDDGESEDSNDAAVGSDAAISSCSTTLIRTSFCVDATIRFTT